MKYYILTGLVVFLLSCSKEDNTSSSPPTDIVFSPTPVDLNSQLPAYLPKMDVPADNPTTEEGIALGRKLFYEPLLSADNSMSCGSCHNQNFAFSDHEKKFSTGIDGIAGDRNSMALFNLGLRRFFFWDGRANSLEEQALEPVKNPIEMHQSWPEASNKLNKISTYREMAYKAFGKATLDSTVVTKAIAQFERSLISSNSKYDRYRKDPKNNPLTPNELNGLKLFTSDRFEFSPGADCWHCHPVNNDFSDNLFHNNGLDQVFDDIGLMAVTGLPGDKGKFKTPSLRNIEYTAPYMHDGRFENLDEVIDFYSEGLHFSPTIDPNMKNVDIGGVRLTPQEKDDLKAFLLTLSDPDFLTNPDYSDPNQ